MERMDGNNAAEVARARAGDEGAFRGLVERHAAAVFRVAYRITGNEHDAEDVVQEAFLKAWKQLATFEDRSSFGSWVHRIAANCAYDALRARSVRRAGLAESSDEALAALRAEAPLADRLVQSSEVQRRIGAALGRLSSLERAAFILRHFEDLSTREIGQSLGVGESAAKQSVFRAVRKLREALLPFVSRGVEMESR
jgi:RNA polymerase sigma-70 factor (ECF subfamily)